MRTSFYYCCLTVVALAAIALDILYGSIFLRALVKTSTDANDGDPTSGSSSLRYSDDDGSMRSPKLPSFQAAGGANAGASARSAAGGALSLRSFGSSLFHGMAGDVVEVMDSMSDGEGEEEDPYAEFAADALTTSTTSLASASSSSVSSVSSSLSSPNSAYRPFVLRDYDAEFKKRKGEEEEQELQRMGNRGQQGRGGTGARGDENEIEDENAAVAAAIAAAMKGGGGKDKKGAAGGAKNNNKKKQRKATGSKIMGADRDGGGTPIDESIFLYGNCSRVSCSET